MSSREKESEHPRDTSNPGRYAAGPAKERVTVRMSRDTLDDIEQAVEAGEYPNRSVAIRDAVDAFQFGGAGDD